MGKKRSIVMSRAAIGALAIIGGTQACGDDTTAASIRAARLAEGCSINSDCIDPLTCAFSHCHVQCTKDRDCDKVGGRCVRAPEGVGVCQLESERDCTTDANCVGDEVCAVDEQCRDLCSDRHPCIEGLVCAASGECAEGQEVDSSGKLSGDEATGGNAGGGTGGKGGSGAATGRGGSGGKGGTTNESGGAAGDEGSGATGAIGTSSGGKGGGNSGGRGGNVAGATAGAGGEAGTSELGVGGTSSGGVAGSAGMSGSSGRGTAGMSGGGQAGAGAAVSEHEPNDDRGTPMPIAPVGVVNGSFTSNTDVDYYEVVTPASDTAGGYYTFALTNNPDGKLRLQVQSGLDFNPIFSDTISGALGASIFGYWASASDQHFLIRCAPYDGQSYPYAYKLTLDYVPVPDSAEPDDTRPMAREVNAGDAVQGYLYSGYQGSSVNTDEYNDYYAVTLGGGSYTVHVTDVPSSVNIGLWVLDSTGAALAQTWQATKGADLLFTSTVPADGKYYFEVSYLNGAPAIAATTSLPDQVPDSFEHPYTFQVTQ